MADNTQGQGGVPGINMVNTAPMNIFDNQKQGQAAMNSLNGMGPINAQTNPQDLFKMIVEGYSSSPSMTSILPQVQSQFNAQNAAAAPAIAGIRESGENQAAMAQSDATARGMRGSDIEAAGMSGARIEAGKREAEFRGNLAMQEAQFMAEKIFTAYGYDKDKNIEMYNNLAQAIGQEISQQRELQMRQEELDQAMKIAKKNSKMQVWSSIIAAVGNTAAAKAGK